MHCRNWFVFFALWDTGISENTVQEEENKKSTEYSALIQEMTIIESKALGSSIMPGVGRSFPRPVQSSTAQNRWQPVPDLICHQQPVSSSGWVKISPKRIGQSCSRALGMVRRGQDRMLRAQSSLPPQWSIKDLLPKAKQRRSWRQGNKFCPCLCLGLRASSCLGLPAVTRDTLLLLQAKGFN